MLDTRICIKDAAVIGVAIVKRVDEAFEFFSDNRSVNDDASGGFFEL